MEGWTIGSDVGQMLAGLGIVVSAFIWVYGRWRTWRQEKAATRARNWHGYILTNGISDWYVRLVDDPQRLSPMVPLEVVDRYGNPDPQMAYSLRLTVKQDGMLARVPTQREFEFLKFLHKKLGYGEGQIIR
jgi:hypothetical protein